MRYEDKQRVVLGALCHDPRWLQVIGGNSWSMLLNTRFVHQLF